MSPWSMKIAITLRARAPIVFRMAMSRLFSITSRMSDATMLSAATITIRPIVIEIAIFSSQSAEKSAWFISVQSCGQVPGPSCSVMAVADRRRLVDVVDAQLDEIGQSAVEEPLGHAEVHEPVGRVELEQSDAEDAGHAQPARRGIIPIGESVPCGVRTVTESPTVTPSCSARSAPSRMPGGLRRPGVGRSRAPSDPSAASTRSMSVTVGFERRVDALDRDERLVVGRR